MKDTETQVSLTRSEASANDELGDAGLNRNKAPSPVSLGVAVNADTLHFQLYQTVMSIFPNFLKCLGIINFKNTLKMHWLP